MKKYSLTYNPNTEELPEVLDSDYEQTIDNYEQTIDELVKAGNNMANTIINNKYSGTAYYQWMNLLDRLER
jgi:hypothetical protein